MSRRAPRKARCSRRSCPTSTCTKYSTAGLREVVQERMEGKVFAVRYAEDLVIGFTHRKDAERVYRVILQRFEKYGLKLHPEKTRLLPFARPETVGPDGEGPMNRGTFGLSGLTHYWGKSPERPLG